MKGISEKTLIKIKDLKASVKLNNGDMLTTVTNANMELQRGRSYAIVGKSGSGKTSLISIIGLLNREYEGEYLYDGISISALKDRDLSILRANNIGFVFQNYSLIKHLRVWENIELPLLYAKKSFTAKQRHEIITCLLKSVGLESKENDYPINLSGGEQQRVAIARALAVSPEAILCDEPTGALDKKTGTQIMELLHSVVKENGIMLLLVTHDPDIAIMPTSIETLVRILLSGDRRRSLSIIFSTSYPPSIHFKNRITGICNIRIGISWYAWTGVFDFRKRTGIWLVTYLLIRDNGIRFSR